MLKEMNQDYKNIVHFPTPFKPRDLIIRSLGLKGVGKCTMCPSTHTLFQCKPGEMISNFNSLLPLVVTAKSVKVYGL